MAFGKNKPVARRRDLSDLPDDWVACLEPGVEVEGNINVARGSIRLNTHIKGDIVSDGAVIVHDQGEVEGNIQSREVNITGKVRFTPRNAWKSGNMAAWWATSTPHACRLTPEGSSTVSAICLHLNLPLNRPKRWVPKNTTEPAPLRATN
jgi:hypothetical protein